MSSAAATPKPWAAGLERPRRAAFIAGLVGLGVCVIAAFPAPGQFFRAYLGAFLFVLGLGLGSLAILMIQHLTGGGWGLLLRRLLEAAASTVPLLALMFVPLLFGLAYLYPWARPDVVSEHAALQWKAPYLNVPFFVVRAVIYFAIWGGLAVLLLRWSRDEDRAVNPALPRRFRMLSGPGLVVFGLAVTFAAFDWGMSLDPEWYSSIYGVMVAIGQMLTAFCFLIVAVVVLAPGTPLAPVLTGERLRDLGGLLLMFVMLWAYVSFSQFLLIWSGNLREEVPWYVVRLHGGWEYVGAALLLLHFILPFLLLLSRDLKRSGPRLAGVAAFLLLMRFVDNYYLVSPSLSPEHPPLAWLWLDAAAVVGLGGLWLAYFLWQLPRLPLLPPYDPRVLEASHHA